MQMAVTDSDIIQAMREDAERGFRLLMASYKEQLYWHIRRLVVSHDDAQDATQEALIRIFRAFNQYDAENSFRAWLFRIATNEALRLLGRQKNAMMLSLEDATAGMLSLKADEYCDDGDALAARLQQAILRLPAKQQLAFNLRYYDDLSYDEIATVTGSTAANVKANYHHAKERIIKYMNEND